MVSFEDRQLLQQPDLATITALGMKFRGRNAWPWFRSYRPGFQPWYLTGAEARFLTLALEQAMEVATRLRGNRRLLPALRPEGRYLVRVPERQGEGWAWKDELRKPKGRLGRVIVMDPPDPERLARFVSFVNDPTVPDPSISFVVERDQRVPVSGRVSMGMPEVRR